MATGLKFYHKFSDLWGQAVFQRENRRMAYDYTIRTDVRNKRIGTSFVIMNFYDKELEEVLHRS